ncbi:unnamed protein product [Nezara viridula]|uniref:Major facilitator superfamily (MFS) profile domain-containing protein n=1 Tax=Nezara viridula TaxID=85310 RepID=A0A9P0MS95_NEZVI|nr:unnamed protein product [Nezara viridula]
MVDLEYPPPDGGSRAWFVMLGSFFVNGLIFGLMNCYSVIYERLQEELMIDNVPGASSKAALVGSLSIGTTFFLSPIAGILTDRIGVRLTTFIGGLFGASGLFLSSFVVHKVEGLYLTYGILFGIGASLAYTPSLVILGHYFERYLGLVNGFVTAGSSVFTMIMPFFIYYLLTTFGLSNTLRCLSALLVCLIGIALLFKPTNQASVQKKQMKSLLNADIWKNKRYVVWATVIPLALFGYFVPYVHMVKFVSIKFPKHDGKILVLCLGVTSGFGRLMFGRLADNPRFNRILLQQVAFIIIGSFTMLIVITPTFFLLEGIALLMGIFDGCFISLLGPIAFDLTGQSGAGQAIGFLLGFCSIPLTVGPPIAGWLYDEYGSYDLPFLLAGVPPIVGGLALSLIRCFPADEEKKNPEKEREVVTLTVDGDA